MATQIQFNSRIPQGKANLNAAIKEAVLEVFATKIHPNAVENSPVTPEGAEYNIAHGKKAPHILGTGTNRRSIDFTVNADENGVQAQLFTQSGYGGYLETGTSKMRAQPYLYPAFAEHSDEIGPAIKVKIEGLPVEKKQ